MINGPFCRCNISSTPSFKHIYTYVIFTKLDVRLAFAKVELGEFHRNQPL